MHLDPISRQPLTQYLQLGPESLEPFVILLAEQLAVRCLLQLLIAPHSTDDESVLVVLSCWR